MNLQTRKFYFWFFPLILLFFLLFCFWPKSPRLPVLKILTYSSFVGVLGPGRIIQQSFESFCKCQIQWFLTEDSTALKQRWAIVPDIDIVIGWDQITLITAPSQQWEDISSLKNQLISSSAVWNHFSHHPYFLPLDWSPIGFLHKKPISIPLSLKSLYKIKGPITFPEPRSSSLGLQFYYWIYEVMQGDKKQIAHFLKQMKSKIYGPLFSWSLSYGAFQKGQSQLGLSYLSSLIYHQKEGEGSYFFSYFKEGHPYQVEFLSISKYSKNKKLAFELAQFLLSKKIQKLILETHYMFPVSKGMNHKILSHREIKPISYNKLDKFIKEKKDLLNLWEENLY